MNAPLQVSRPSPVLRLRRALLCLPAAALPGIALGATPRWSAVEPGRPLRFPRDHGAHPAYRTEWWYLTGWLSDDENRPLGVQITFFRSRTRHDSRDPSRFAPVQLLFAHAAIASPQRARLAHAERSARPGFGLAQFSEDDLDVSIRTWRLWRTVDDRILARIDDDALGLDLVFTPPGPPVAQGKAGFSRKGSLPTQASWYYSRPQLSVAGTVRGPDRAPTRTVKGTAWLDHEWSSEILDAQAAGWDWVGLNLKDGSALMAFRIRRQDGSTLWSDTRWISPAELAGRTAPAAAGERGGADATPAAEFVPLRLWQSPRTGARWPVAMRLRIGDRELTLEPLFDDQEIDTTASTGTVYWEGAVRVLQAGLVIGTGYLELTGYASALRL